MNKQIFIISLLNIQYHPKFGSKEFLPYFSIYIIYSVYSHIYLIQVQWTSKVLYQMSQMYLSITSLNLFTFSSLFLEIFLPTYHFLKAWPTCGGHLVIYPLVQPQKPFICHDSRDNRSCFTLLKAKRSDIHSYFKFSMQWKHSSNLHLEVRSTYSEFWIGS